MLLLLLLLKCHNVKTHFVIVHRFRNINLSYICASKRSERALSRINFLSQEYNMTIMTYIQFINQ